MKASLLKTSNNSQLTVLVSSNSEGMYSSVTLLKWSEYEGAWYLMFSSSNAKNLVKELGAKGNFQEETTNSLRMIEMVSLLSRTSKT